MYVDEVVLVCWLRECLHLLGSELAAQGCAAPWRWDLAEPGLVGCLQVLVLVVGPVVLGLAASLLLVFGSGNSFFF